MKFELVFPYYKAEAIVALKKLPSEKRIWDGNRKKWIIDGDLLFDTARLITEYFPKLAGTLLRGDVYKEVREYAMEKTKQKQKSIADSLAIKSNTKIPSPKGLDYYPFQKAGIDYALQRKGTLIADQMGLGKTMQAIGFINYKKLKRILIICPATLKTNWEKELKKWLTFKSTIGIAYSKQPFPNKNIVIINYDIINKFEDVKNKTWDLLICDESHYIKNNTAERTRQIVGSNRRGIAPIKADHYLFLTGTPILNRPREIWTVANFLHPEEFSNFFSFAHRYCGAYNTGYGWNYNGASNLEELQDRLRSLFMVRRLKSEVLKELPDKIRQVITIPYSSLATQIDNEKILYDKYKDIIQNIKGMEVYEKENKCKSTAPALSEISAAREQTALAKVPFVIEHIKESLEQEEKIVVFAHHHSVVNAIASNFKRTEYVLLTGQTPQKTRELAIRAFQESPTKRLFIGSILAAGVGITLTAASHIIFAELDWVPGNLCQAEDRCHRIGQKDSVFVQHMIAEQSIDSLMIDSIFRKQEIIEKALNKKERRKK